MKYMLLFKTFYRIMNRILTMTVHLSYSAVYELQPNALRVITPTHILLIHSSYLNRIS